MNQLIVFQRDEEIETIRIRIYQSYFRNIIHAKERLKWSKINMERKQKKSDPTGRKEKTDFIPGLASKNLKKNE